MSTPDQSRHIYNTTDTTGTTYSEVFSLKRGSLFSLHIDATSSLAGTLTLWASNKDAPDAAVADWVQITDVTFTAVASALKEFVNAGNAAGRFYKLRFVYGSGTGDLDVWANFGEA